MCRRLFSSALLVWFALSIPAWCQSQASSVCRGDLTGDGILDLNDLKELVLLLRHDGARDSGFPPAADVNQDGKINVGDVIALLRHFNGKAPLPSCNLAPELGQNEFTLNENPTAGQVVGRVQATDPNPGQVLSFRIAAGDDGAFQLSADGELRVRDAALIDFETSTTHVLLVEVRDDGTPSLSDQGNVTITITNANERPNVQAQEFTIDENSAAGSAVGTVAAQDPDAGQTLQYAIEGGSATFSINPTSGALTVLANQALDFETSPTLTLTVRVTDNGTPAASNTATITIRLRDVQEVPNAVDDQFTVLEDSPAAALDVVANDTDPEGDPRTVTAVGTGNQGGSISVAPGGTSVLYAPAHDFSGTETFTYTIGDGHGGADTASVSVTITDVNDAPAFTKGADQTVLEDAGAQTVTGWATAISAGPAPESSQTVTFLLSNNTNPTLFAAAPAIDATGTLTYTAAADANGSATITVQAQDSGGTANAGVDTSAPQTFTITVTAVNDAPSFTKGADVTVLEDSGAHSQVNWATGISVGPADEVTQTVSFAVTGNTNAALFSVPPVIGSTGALSFTPAADASGTATITIRAQDSGGTSNGGVDTSATQTFVITVTDVNDAPAFTKGADQTVLEDAGAQTVAGWATGISAGPAAESSQTVGFVVTNNTNASLFSSVPAIDATGALTYTALADANGSATITVEARDDGGTANGGVDTSAAQTFTITITAVNDAPSFTKGVDVTALEDSGAYSQSTWATGISAGPTDESSQTVTMAVTGNTNSGLFAVQPAISSTGALSFTPAADASGTATITVQAQDDGGTADGGVNTSAPQTFTITVTEVNDAPSFTKGADQTALEDAGAQTISGWATAISAGPAAESSQTVGFVVTNNTNPGLFSALPAIDATGILTYTPAADASGTATITLVAQDSGGTADGGLDTSAPQTFTITITAVNDAPSFTQGGNISVLEDSGAYSQATWATGISAGPANESSQTVTLAITGNTNAGLFAVQPAIGSTGALTFTPAADASGTATITIVAQDNGGTANSGVDTSAPQTFTITITDVNDAPGFTKGADQTALEDAGAQTISGWATAISAGPASESSQTVGFVVTNNTNTGLFSALPAIDATGTLTYTPAADASGTATITLVAQDSGGTADGGLDTSAPQTFTITVTAVNDAPSFTQGGNISVLEDSGAYSQATWATGISAGPANESSQTVTLAITGNTNAALFTVQPAVGSTGALSFTPAADASGTATITVQAQDDGGTTDGGVNTSAPQTFTITITDVNDAPSFTKGANQAILEDAAAQSISNWATAISQGPAAESSQTLSFLVTNDNNGLFSTQPAISPVGTLTYTVAANANGSATVSVFVQDSGGTANGGVNTSSLQIFMISVTAVNDAPSFTKGLDVSVLEDSGGFSQAAWATGISKGPADESTQTVTLAVTGNTNPGLFAVQPALGTTGTLTFTPAADTGGTATITVQAQDDGGTADGGANTSAPQTFTITVTDVNDAPSFTRGADQAILEDAPAQSISNWATAISKGPAAESSQTLGFLVTNDNNGLFSAQPAISPVGTLTYTVAANANGSATVSIVVQDSGGTANGGADSSAPQSFIISVTAVNDAPSFTKGLDVAVFEDSGVFSQAGWATGVSAGPADESTQTVTLEITGNTNAALFLAGPAINSSGTLSFTLASNAFGSATIQVTASDTGGTANGGADSSAPQSFTIVVTGVNDPPSFTPGSNQTLDEDAAAQNIASFVTAISPGPSESGQTVSFAITGNTNSGLFSAGPAITPAGTLTFTLAANKNGVATITYQAVDNGGTANGGVDTSAPASFTITVNPVNDPPVVPDQALTVQPNMKITYSGLLAGVTDPDSGDTGFTPTFSLTAVTFAACPTCVSSVGDWSGGSFVFDPPPGGTGPFTLTYSVTDNGNPAPGAVGVGTITITCPNNTVVWFVNPSAGVNGDGRLSNPFRYLSGYAGANNDADDVDLANHRIFIYSGTAAVGAGIALNSGEWLIGQGAGTTGQTFDTLMGFTPPAGTWARPTIAGTRPTIQGTVTLNTTARLQGLNITTANLAGISSPGSAMSNVSVSQMAVTSTNAVAVTGTNCTTCTFNLDSVNANGGAGGVVLGGSGSLTIAGNGAAATGGTIQNMTGPGISLSGAWNTSLSWMDVKNNGDDGFFGHRANRAVHHFLHFHNQWEFRD